MPKGLKRYYGARHLHYITCSCFQRRPGLGSARRRDLFLRILEQLRRRYRFVVVGYVVMPEHFHLLLTEPEVGDPSKVMQAIKQRVARRLLPRRKKPADSRQGSFWELPPPARRHFWQPRFYDFNVWSRNKRLEKLRYMHQNPVKRGLVTSPELWAWSSFRFYALGEPGPVKVNSTDVLSPVDIGPHLKKSA